MASAYGYIAVANLEARSGVDYSGRSSAYTDTVIEAQISQAERLINAYCNTSWTGTIPDAVVYVTTELAYRLMYNIMIFDGTIDRDNPPKKEEHLLDVEIMMLQPFVVSNGHARSRWVSEMQQL